MKICLACLRPYLTRWDRVLDWLHYLLIVVVALSVGYLVRDSVFLKRENSVLWKLVNVYVGKVEVDKVANENTRLRAKVR